MVEALGDAFASLGTVSDSYLKTLNMELLMTTRSEDFRTRRCALGCLYRLWLVNGRDLVGLKRETMPFLLECAEDEHEDVVHEARALKAALDKF